MILYIILFIVIFILSYIIWNLSRTISVYEDTLNLYESWIENFASIVEKIDRDLNDLDSEGTFRADDEIGYFYQAIYSILKRLEEFKLIEPGEELNDAENLLHERDRRIYSQIQRVRRPDVQVEDIQEQDRKSFKQVSRKYNK